MDRWDTCDPSAVVMVTPDGDWVKYEDAQKRIAELEADVTRLREGLEAAKIEHAEWCPRSGSALSRAQYKKSLREGCTCGVDTHNAAIDALLEKP